MPVNTAALKTFAPAMRRQLLEAVGRKLDLLLTSQTPDTLSTYAKQIAELREQEEENREQLLERVAYTWFNRLCALRYLDARGWHPFGCKVLMPGGEGETQPELLKLMRAGSLPSELKPLTNEARLHGLLDGQIPPAMAGSDPQGEVYRELVLASCRSYHQLLPELFEGLDDASELLLPDDLLGEGSIAGGFRSAISDADCEDVEIIGWLYQFYISEKKDQVIGKVVKSEDIPAATQLFTPNWIVKYMVQNSLGATWLATYPDSPLKGQMEFYIEPAEQTPEVQAQLAAITPESLDPEALTLIDPACGSGHILVEAYDLLKAIYLERGYRQRDIPELILTKNLFGLDICPRAAQLAAFSLLMKGREDDRRLLERGLVLNVLALQNSVGLNVDTLIASLDLSTAELARSDLRILVELFAHATTFGSLIQVPALLAEKLPAISHAAKHSGKDIFAAQDLLHLGMLARQAELLARQYDAVVANPPYMGGKAMNPIAKKLVSEEFANAKSDFFACFIERSYTLAKALGRVGMVTMQSWMFLSSFEKMRDHMLAEKTLLGMAHLGPGGFSHASAMVVQTTAFVFANSYISNYVSCFLRLLEGGEDEKRLCLLQQRADCRSGPENGVVSIQSKKASPGIRFDVPNNVFTNIPGKALAYWSSSALRLAYSKRPPLKVIGDTRQGMATSNNARFLRLWHEVARSGFQLNCLSRAEAKDSNAKWVPYNKGGEGRKWWGNQDHIIDWRNDGEAVIGYAAQLYGSPTRTIKSLSEYFKPCISWSKISLAAAFRFYPEGFIFDVAGCCIFFKRSEEALCALCFLNSRVAESLLAATSPTLNFEAGHIAALPFKLPDLSVVTKTASIAQELISLAKADWDSLETSWDFLSSPLLRSTLNKSSLFESWNNWLSESSASVRRSQELEELVNNIFIAEYALIDELSSAISEEEITLSRRDARMDVAAFLSYATGCMMGRYSLHQPGLVLADSRDSQAAQLAAYEEKVGKPLSNVQFKPDPDGIIPVLDGEWFEDDIVARTREFLAVTFPESTVTENLRFIEESLGKDIRKYFCSEFYKDHLQTYKKRPIYWMVQSPKKAFSCLIYLHRYTKDTLNQVLNNYFRPYLQKLEARQAQLGLDQLNDALPTRDRTAARKEADKITKVLKECQVWEQDALLPLAQQRIELDLDDGVKVNYLKLQDVLAPIPGLAAKEE